MGFLGQDWSLANLKNRVGGLLDNPGSTMENPWFRAGMGLLSENQKPFGGNWAEGAMAGMMGAKATKQEREDRERIQELRRKIAAWFEQQRLAQMGGVRDPRTGAWSSPLPPGQQPPGSIMDLQRSSG